MQAGFMEGMQNKLHLRQFWCFLSGAIGGFVAGPYRDYEGDRQERLPFQDQAMLRPLPQH